MPDTKDSVDTEELGSALLDYVELANGSARVRKTLSGWTCRVHIEATDTGARFTLPIEQGTAQAVTAGHDGEADLVVRGHSADLAEIFWGDANPASGYMQGAVTTQGRQDDVMKLDAMAMFVFLGQ